MPSGDLEADLTALNGALAAAGPGARFSRAPSQATGVGTSPYGSFYSKAYRRGSSESEASDFDPPARQSSRGLFHR